MKFEFQNALLRAHIPQGSEMQEALMARSKTMNPERGSHLLFPGEICKHLYFVNKGFFRTYRHVGSLLETSGFCGKDQLLTSVESFLLQIKGAEGIVCEQPGTVLRISFHDWMALEDLSSEFLIMSNRILRDLLISFHKERDLFRMASTKEKYLHLCEQVPGIINMVSQKHIASYLGISPPTMSGMLRELLFKPNKNG